MNKKLLYLIYIISLHSNLYSQNNWISKFLSVSEDNSQAITHDNSQKKTSMKDKLELIYKIKNYRLKVREFGTVVMQLQKYTTQQKKYASQSTKEDENKLLIKFYNKLDLKYRKLYKDSYSINILHTSLTEINKAFQKLQKEINTFRTDKTLQKLKSSKNKTIKKIAKRVWNNLRKLENKLKRTLHTETKDTSSPLIN